MFAARPETCCWPPSGGVGGRAVAVQGPCAVGAGRGHRPVREQDDAPPPPVHGDQMVEGAQKEQVSSALILGSSGQDGFAMTNTPRPGAVRAVPSSISSPTAR